MLCFREIIFCWLICFVSLECFRFVMNTWCGVYRRVFLEKYKIAHNKTPGASFQDNGFRFKGFCCAEKNMFLDKAFYMNRRDNL